MLQALCRLWGGGGAWGEEEVPAVGEAGRAEVVVLAEVGAWREEEATPAAVAAEAGREANDELQGHGVGLAHCHDPRPLPRQR